MSLITWTNDISVNHAEIDRQHQKLISLINLLFDAMKEGKGVDVLQHIFNELSSYTVYHFTYEEKIMEAYNFPYLTEHQWEHQQLIRKVADMQQQLQVSTSMLTVATMNFLRDWLNHHIKEEDQRLSAYIQKK